LTKQNNLMTSISTQALYNPYFNLQTTSQFPQHFHSLGYTSIELIYTSWWFTLKQRRKSMTVWSALYMKLQTFPQLPRGMLRNCGPFILVMIFCISRDSLYLVTCPLDHTIRFYLYLYLIISHAFTRNILLLFARFFLASVYKPCAEYFFLSLMMP